MYILDVYKIWLISFKLIRIGYFFYIKIIIRYYKISMFFGKGGEGVISCVVVFFLLCVLNCSGCGVFFDWKIF